MKLLSALATPGSSLSSLCSALRSLKAGLLSPPLWTAFSQEPDSCPLGNTKDTPSSPTPGTHNCYVWKRGPLKAQNLITVFLVSFHFERASSQSDKCEGRAINLLEEEGPEPRGPGRGCHSGSWPGSLLLPGPRALLASPQGGARLGWQSCVLSASSKSAWSL